MASFDLSAVWGDDFSSAATVEVTGVGGTIIAESSAEESVSGKRAEIVPDMHSILMQELIELRKESQRRDIMFLIGALTGFSILIHYLHRIHHSLPRER
jgi:hypothetical protein